jgi:hypothetical protein
MLDGHMRHEDHLGNRGDLGPGDVQWMTAAAGIIHSEMPQQTEGRMRGFQLWLNLPAAELPQRTLPSGARIKVIAGSLDVAGQRLTGPVNRPDSPLSTDPLYVDIALPATDLIELPLPADHTAFLYLYEGEASVGPDQDAVRVPRSAAAVLGAGGAVRIQAGGHGARLLLLAARALREPVVQYGPFVMNTRAEIERAVDDFRAGRLGLAAS